MKPATFFTFTFTMSAGALALALPFSNDSMPTNFANDSSLEKRQGHYGWLSSYDDPDTKCSGYYGGPRPKVHNKCIKFTPLRDNIGINWGTNPQNFDALDFFSDDSCKVKVGKRVQHSEKSGGKGPNTCVSVKANGGPVNSVKGVGTYFD